MNKIWQLFSSVRTAVVLFIIISASSFFGTVVIQSATEEVAVGSLKKILGEELAVKAYPLLEKLGITDMYGSWWFVSLLFLFAVNITICSIERLPNVWRAVKEPVKPLPDEYLLKLVPKEVITKKPIEEIKGLITDAVRKSGFGRLKEHEGNMWAAERGRYSRLGVYIVHFSIVLILAGAMINGLFGFNGYVNIMEGEAANAVYLPNKKEIPLNFSIKCDDFDAEYYEGTNRPRAFKSSLSIIKDGSVKAKKTIDVNDPWHVEGVKIYQTEFGFYFRKDADFVLRVKNETLRLKYGDTFKLPGSGMTGKIADFNPSFYLDPSTGQSVIRERSMTNPAVLIEFYDKGALKESRWILKREPRTGIIGGDAVGFLDLWGVQYTGLQVNNTPGLPLVYFGFIALSIGLYMAFFMSHKKIWINISDRDKGFRVIVAGSSNKGGDLIKSHIEKISALLK
jgi:cytochrome c biogenesis protein